MKKTMILSPAIAVLLLTGCGSIGPGTVNRDRFDYTRAIAESWKTQMLVNIVKLRYNDTPVFLDVPSVISQYAIQGKIDLGAGWNTALGGGDTQTLGVEGLYAERPTITYAPLSGEKFTKSLLTPIPPASLVFLIQSGWPVKTMFELCVKSVNDLDNRSTSPAFARSLDPEFQRLVERMARIQRAGAVGARSMVCGDDFRLGGFLVTHYLDRDITANRQSPGCG